MADSVTLEQCAEISHIPGRTVWRWRHDRLLTVAADWDGLTPREGAQLLARRQTLPWGARFDVEDVTRLLLVAHLGELGWDRQRLITEALGHPWAGNIQLGAEPHWLLIFQPSDKSKLDRLAVDSLPEVMAWLQEIPTAYVANLFAFRKAAAQAMAKLAKQEETYA